MLYVGMDSAMDLESYRKGAKVPMTARYVSRLPATLQPNYVMLHSPANEEPVRFMNSIEIYFWNWEDLNPALKIPSKDCLRR